MNSVQQDQSERDSRLPRVLIADDDPVVRSMLSMSFENRYEVVASVGDAEAAVREAAATLPEVAVVDVDMPGGGAHRAVQGIADVSPQTAIVVLSGDESRQVVIELLSAGAMTYVRKGLPADKLTEAIERSIRAHAA
jgi:DNA-binding NarL/FixJ family response regulator